jgi:hypothetical protein
MDIVPEAHRTLANMINIYALIVGIWGLVNFARKQPPDGNFNGALAVAVGLFALEAIAGVVLMFMGRSPSRDIHWLYGVTMVITIPAIFVFTRGRNSSRESFLYGAGMLFIWGLAERAGETGR